MEAGFKIVYNICMELRRGPGYLQNGIFRYYSPASRLEIIIGGFALNKAVGV